MKTGSRVSVQLSYPEFGDLTALVRSRHRSECSSIPVVGRRPELFNDREGTGALDTPETLVAPGEIGQR